MKNVVIRQASVFFFLLLSSALASATPVTWYLDGVEYADGTKVSGSYVYDADVPKIVSISIFTTPGTTFTTPLTFADPSASFPSPIRLNALASDCLNNCVGEVVLSMYFDGSMTNNGGTLNLKPSNSIIGTCSVPDCETASSPLTFGRAGGITTTPPSTSPGITVSAISGDTTEAGGTATFSVVLDSQPTASVSIGLSSSDATEGQVTSSATLVFNTSDWDTPQQVTVTGQNDAVVDGDITYTIITAAAVSNDGDYSNLDADDVSVTNLDDDVLPPPPPSSTPIPVPTMSAYGLVLTMLGLLFVASRRLRATDKRK